MARRIAVIVLACCLSAFVGAAGGSARADLLPPLFSDHRPQPSLVFVYHGWRVNAARTARIQRPAKTVRALKAQIDLVEHVGLPPKVLRFMRTIPIAAEPGAGEDAGGYARASGVTIPIKGLDEKRPVMLRQLLYAYQDQVLPGGFANPQAARFRQEAIEKHVWPKSALMLRDDTDYFAMVASAYLCGAITREPYNRANLRKTQPAAYQWLADLFDSGRARR